MLRVSSEELETNFNCANVNSAVGLKISFQKYKRATWPNSSQQFQKIKIGDILHLTKKDYEAFKS